MNKPLILILFVSLYFSTTIYADALKNSLTNLMHTKKSASVVDLGSIDLNAKQKPKKPMIKHHAQSDIVATVNAHKILKKDADHYLRKRTQGKIKDFDILPMVQKKRLIAEMMLPTILLDVAKKELNAEEIQSIYSRIWMEKEAKTIEIKDEEILKVYNEIKQNAQAHNDTKTMPAFESIKSKLKMQMIEKHIIENLTKDAQIKVAL